MGKLSQAVLLAALRDHDGRVCSAAIRLCEPLLADEKILAALLPLQNRPEVRLQLTLSIGGLKNPKVEDALITILCDATEKPFIADAALTGLAGRELALLQRILADPGWEKETPGRAATLSALTSAAYRGKVRGSSSSSSRSPPPNGPNTTGASLQCCAVWRWSTRVSPGRRGSRWTGNRPRCCNWKRARTWRRPAPHESPRYCSAGRGIRFLCRSR